jgi:hypothetical protein
VGDGAVGKVSRLLSSMSLFGGGLLPDLSDLSLDFVHDKCLPGRLRFINAHNEVIELIRHIFRANTFQQVSGIRVST